jgi:hypothetical protein
MNKIFRRLIPVYCAIIVLFAFSALGAQSIWQDYTSREGISIEFLKPNYATEEDYSFLTSVTFLSGRFPVTRTIIFSGELPFSYVSWDVPQGPDLGAKQTFGNPYFGLEIQKHIPHRYPFLLVDRILDVEKDHSIVGIKNVTMNDCHRCHTCYRICQLYPKEQDRIFSATPWWSSLLDRYG